MFIPRWSITITGDLDRLDRTEVYILYIPDRLSTLFETTAGAIGTITWKARFTVVRLRCRRNLKFGNFTLLFGRRRQRGLPECVLSLSLSPLEPSFLLLSLFFSISVTEIKIIHTTTRPPVCPVHVLRNTNSVKHPLVTLTQKSQNCEENWFTSEQQELIFICKISINTSA